MDHVFLECHNLKSDYLNTVQSLTLRTRKWLQLNSSFSKILRDGALFCFLLCTNSRKGKSSHLCTIKHILNSNNMSGTDCLTTNKCRKQKSHPSPCKILYWELGWKEKKPENIKFPKLSVSALEVWKFVLSNCCDKLVKSLQIFKEYKGTLQEKSKLPYPTHYSHPFYILRWQYFYLRGSF